MANLNWISIEVAYATPERQCLIACKVPLQTTIEKALISSGILQEFPEIDLDKVAVGVFSKPRSLADFLEEGDRVEIYRPLEIDPKEARRLRASVKKKRALRSASPSQCC